MFLFVTIWNNEGLISKLPKIDLIYEEKENLASIFFLPGFVLVWKIWTQLFKLMVTR